VCKAANELNLTEISVKFSCVSRTVLRRHKRTYWQFSSFLWLCTRLNSVAVVRDSLIYNHIFVFA